MTPVAALVLMAALVACGATADPAPGEPDLGEPCPSARAPSDLPPVTTWAHRPAGGEAATVPPELPPAYPPTPCVPIGSADTVLRRIRSALTGSVGVRRSVRRSADLPA